jgi:integrase
VEGPDEMSLPKDADKRLSTLRGRSPASAASLIIAQLADTADLAPVSLQRVSDLVQGFAGFLATSGVARPQDIRSSHAEAFVRSLTRSGNEPSLATMHLRRSALRIFFKEAKILDLLDSDPSADIVLPKRTYRNLRPLTDKEIARCRSFATGTGKEPSLAKALALAEAGARCAELGHVTAGDLDLGAGWVRMPGCSSTTARWSPLTDWGREHLAQLLPDSDAEPRLPLLGSGSRGSIHELIASTLRRAGLANKPGVRPNSVPAWRGAHELESGATIDEVARLLGMRSLDRTASFIGFEWKDNA